MEPKESITAQLFIHRHTPLLFFLDPFFHPSQNFHLTLSLWVPFSMIRAILCRVLGKRVVSTLPFRAAPIVIAQSSLWLMLNHDKHLSQVTNIDESSISHSMSFCVRCLKTVSIVSLGRGKTSRRLEKARRTASRAIASLSTPFREHSLSTAVTSI